jgi:TPP-dependent pyruvate/acetoin dehydrogenase alpha subunit
VKQQATEKKTFMEMQKEKERLEAENAQKTEEKQLDPIKNLANELFRNEELSNNTDSLNTDENDDRLAQEIEFSDSSDANGEDELSLFHKNVAQHKQFKQMNKKLTKATQQQYFDAVARHSPKLEKGRQLKLARATIQERIKLEKSKNLKYDSD